MIDRKEIGHQECTRDPIFLFQFRFDGRGHWQTETVFLTREEAEEWGEDHSYRWPCWRVYCVAAQGLINVVLNRGLGD